MNFESLIEQAIAAGVSPEALASGFTSALNKVQEGNKSKKEKEQYITNARAEVKEAINRGQFTLEVAATIATINAANKFPEWPLKELKAYRKSVTPSLEVGMNMINGTINGKSPSAVAREFLQKDWPFVLEELVDKDDLSDNDRIRAFLRSI